jgi:hypothetical protein
MSERATTAQSIDHLTDFLIRVQDNGESFVVERDGVSLATLAPVPKTGGITWHEFAALYRDLPRPDDDFADDLEAVHAALAPV